MSPDLRLATVYVMPLGGKDVKPVLAALERNKKYIRGEVAHAVNLKFAPDIRFLARRDVRRSDRIERLLAQRQGPPGPRQGLAAWHAARKASRSTAGSSSTSRSA